MNKPGIKQVEVQIMSQSYMLACPVDGEEALREAVAKVDGAMCRIRDAGKVKARDRIAVLAALNIAFELFQKDAGAFRNSSFGQTESGETEESARLAEQEAQLQALLQRLDAALAPDGRLF
ncbi:cell division protein ZapA [Tepidicella xavieri]|jgi:cell division protein ZapA|uniref:Cell division protein ZapA n=1 Tax=Tepidicella xavieri TaxID=360241 RepID=A0A4V3D6I8_9BURK|nr:cell division protein ZapA [Tepidicella xavieri]TDQ44067.1 cell division protein ZapA [Tepidicella xavieri]